MKRQLVIVIALALSGCSGGDDDDDTGSANVTGTWAGPLSSPCLASSQFTLQLTESGGSLSGTLLVTWSSGSSGPHGIGGTWNGTQLAVTANIVLFTLNGTVSDTYWSGTYAEPGGLSCPFEATINGAPFPS